MRYVIPLTGAREAPARMRRSEAAKPRSVAVVRVPDMTDTALSSLVAAWTTTMIATTLFIAVLAVSRVWDGAVFLRALHDTLASPL